MEAQITGTQRKVMSSSVRPAKLSHGTSGISLTGGRTLPFRVERQWSAPAGRYPEAWYLVRPDSREVLYEGPSVERSIWGLQGLTEVVDEVTDSFALDPGKYTIVFALGGQMGGQLEVEAVEAPPGA